MTISVESSLVSYCPLGCAHCNLGKEVAEKKPSLGIDEVKVLLNKLGQSNVQHVWHRMGECFLRDDFVSIMKLTNDQFINSNVLTSGVGLTASKMQEIFELPGNNQLVFSLDGHTKDINDAIRFDGSFKKVIDLLECATRLKEKMTTSRLTIGISHTLTNVNCSHIEDFLELMNRYAVDFLSVHPAENLGNNKHGQFTLGADEKKQAHILFPALRDRYDFELRSDVFLAPAAVKTPSDSQRTEPSLPCLAIETIYIDHEGFMFPCRSMVDEEFEYRSFLSSGLWSIRPPNVLDDEIESVEDSMASELFLAYKDFVTTANDMHHGQNAESTEGACKDSGKSCALYCPLWITKNEREHGNETFSVPLEQKSVLPIL